MIIIKEGVWGVRGGGGEKGKALQFRKDAVEGSAGAARGGES